MAPLAKRRKKCYIMKQEFVALASAIVFGTDDAYCIHLLRQMATNRKFHVYFCILKERFANGQQVNFFSVYLKFHRRPLRNSQLRKRAFHNLEYTKSRRYSQIIVESLH